ncbi:MAG: hypothetical protein ACAI38_04900 [Myxococcota bacterium]
MARHRLAFLLATAALSGCWPSPAEREAQVAREVAPATMEGTAPTAAVRQILKLRVYADASHRTRDPSWDLHVRELVEQANRLLAPKFAVRLEVSNTRIWERSAGDDLQAALAELQTIDAGEDTGWIVGLMGASREVTNDIHAMGTSVTLGRHMVLRGINDPAEFAALGAQLEGIAEFERGNIYRQRRAHKELVMFLHHLGHTLGAPHARDASSIMAVTYDPQTRDLGALATRIFALGLAYRDQLFDNGAVASWHGKLNVLLIRESAEADAADLARVRDAIEHPWRSKQAGMAKPKKREFDNLTKETFTHAETYANSGRLKEAWTLANVMIEKHPDNDRLLDFGCNVRASMAIGAPTDHPSRVKGFAEERELCARAADASDLVTSEVFLARLDALAGSTASALQQAREVDKKLSAEPVPAAAPQGAPATPIDPKVAEDARTAWTNIANIYAQLGCIVSAERAGKLAGGEGAATIATWSVAARRQQGLPAGQDVGVNLGNDCEYAAILRDAREGLAVGHLRDVRALLSRGLAKFPKAPGLQVIGCELEARQGHQKEAREQCTRALATYDELVRAHQLLGFMEARGGNTDAAVQHLLRAVELDPDLESAWTDLAKLYMYDKNNNALTAIREAYKTKFGRDMPVR